MDEAMQNRFVEEAEELIGNLENEILNLENDYHNAASIGEIFRVMHTLKGTAAMFGFDKIGDLTHHLENIYDLIRENVLQVDNFIIDITFQAIDIIKDLLDNKEQGNHGTYDALLSRVKEISEDKPSESNNPIEIPAPSNEAGSLKNLFFIHFKPDHDIFFRGINPYLSFEELYEIGELQIYPAPEEQEPSDEEKQSFSKHWSIFLVTSKNEEDINFIFMFYQVTEYDIIKIDMDGCLHDKTFIASYLKYFPEDKNLQVPRQCISRLNISVSRHKTENIPAEEANIEQATNVSAVHQIKSIKVPAGKLDELINLVGELVITNAQLAFHTGQFNDLSLSKIIGKVDKLSKNLRENTLELRLVPINLLTNKFKRLVRDLSLQTNKNIEFVTEGTDTELDSNIINQIDSPLMHIIRNSIDHAIESPEERIKKNKPEKGIIRLFAYHSGANVFIQVQDDGKGINPETIRKKAVDKGMIPSDANLSKKEIYDLIFLPGFSTAKQVSEISGRGVGMDIVKKSITDLRGEIEVDSEIDLGTSITLKLPLTLSIIDTLTVRIGDKTYLIPLNSIESCHKKKHSELFKSLNRRTEFDGVLIPFIYLREELRIEGECPEVENLIMINVNEKRYALVVDKVLGEHQAVVKPISFINNRQEYFSGASILGNGQVALILDINQLILKMKQEITVV